MTALKLRPGSIPIIGNNLEANGTRHWTERLSSSNISVIHNLIIVIVILFFVVTETHYKNPKKGTREREMVLSEKGQEWENKGRKGVIWDLKSLVWGWRRLNFFGIFLFPFNPFAIVGFFLRLLITLVQSTSPTVAIHCRCLHLPLTLNYFKLLFLTLIYK